MVKYYPPEEKARLHKIPKHDKLTEKECYQLRIGALYDDRARVTERMLELQDACKELEEKLAAARTELNRIVEKAQGYTPADEEDKARQVVVSQAFVAKILNIAQTALEETC